MRAEGRKTAGGRQRLLDAAEELFAAKGYDGASMRAITRLAGVELGLANYHFGAKEELYRQVLARRAPEMAADLDRALADALEESAVDAVLAAFARTHLARLHDPDPGWRNYIRLAAATALRSHRGRLGAAASVFYQPVLDRYRAAIGRFAPGLPDDEIERSFYVYHMAVISILLDADLGGGGAVPPCASNVDALVATMVRIFARGV